MDFSKILFFVFACLLALSSVSTAPSPKRKIIKEIEKLGRNVRDGLVKAGPAVKVVGEVAAIAKG